MNVDRLTLSTIKNEFVKWNSCEMFKKSLKINLYKIEKTGAYHFLYVVHFTARI